MTNHIVLESADDVATVWSNWHQDITLILDDGIQAATNDINNGVASGSTDTAYNALQAIRSLIDEKPVSTEYSINQSVMARTRALVLGEDQDDANVPVQAVAAPEEEECDCIACVMRREVKAGNVSEKAALLTVLKYLKAN